MKYEDEKGELTFKVIEEDDTSGKKLNINFRSYKTDIEYETTQEIINIHHLFALDNDLIDNLVENKPNFVECDNKVNVSWEIEIIGKEYLIQICLSEKIYEGKSPEIIQLQLNNRRLERKIDLLESQIQQIKNIIVTQTFANFETRLELCDNINEISINHMLSYLHQNKFNLNLIYKIILEGYNFNEENMQNETIFSALFHPDILAKDNIKEICKMLINNGFKPNENDKKLLDSRIKYAEDKTKVSGHEKYINLFYELKKEYY